jgi:hypothetical protein
VGTFWKLMLPTNGSQKVRESESDTSANILDTGAHILEIDAASRWENTNEERGAAPHV